jgi:hypothetical protein
MYTPHLDGEKIPEPVKERTRARILAHATEHYAGKFTRLEVRFRGAFCYIDAFEEPHLGEDFSPPDWPETREQRWTLAFYTYSNEKYVPCLFGNGKDHGTPEQGFDVGAVYLDG